MEGAEYLNLSGMNDNIPEDSTPGKDVVHPNDFQEKEINKLVQSVDILNINDIRKHTTLQPRYIDRHQSCFVTSSKDAGFESLNVNLQCNPQDADDLEQLKAAAARLKLTTKRPSYVAWQAEVQGRSTILKQTANTTNSLTEDRRAWISNTLHWITQELADMRSQDQHLARQLLTIRQNMQKIKLDKSCEVYQDMLADVQLEMEELEELAEICDQLPEDSGLHDNPLHHIGVTRMNICARRFSTC